MGYNKSEQIDIKLLESITGGKCNVSVNESNALTYSLGLIEMHDKELYKEAFNKVEEMRMSDIDYTINDYLNLIYDYLKKVPTRSIIPPM